MEVVPAIPSCSPPSPPTSTLSSAPMPYPRRPRGNTTPATRSSLLPRRTSNTELLNSLLGLPSPSSSPSSSPGPSRTSSALSLLHSSQSLSHSPNDSAANPRPHASPIVSMSPATATGTLRAPRPSAGLPFIPLTPIIASPRLTPQISATSHLKGKSPPGADIQGAQRPEPAASPSQIHAVHQQEIADYFARGGQTAMLPMTVQVIQDAATLPMPTWTSTPPTPPHKSSERPPVPTSPRRKNANRSRSESRSTSRTRSTVSSVRPASLAGVSASRSSSTSSSSQIRPSASLPSSASLASSSTATSSATVRGRHPRIRALGHGSPPRRRMSLPPDLSKPLPPTPAGGRTHTASSVPARESATKGERTASQHRAMAAVARESSARKLFHLDGDTDADASEAEGERERRRREEERKRRSGSAQTQRQSRERGTKRASSRRQSVEAEVREPRRAMEMDRDKSKDREAETPREDTRNAEVLTELTEAEVERLRAATRRYHALMELLSTEVGYLMDLRALVTVYLEQLPTLSTSSSTPSSSPVLSLSALNLTRSLPSSRSSFLHATPAPSPSPSAASHMALGSDSGHGPPSETELKKEPSKRQKSRDRSSKAKSREREAAKHKDKGKDGGKHKRKERDGDQGSRVDGHQVLGGEPATDMLAGTTQQLDARNKAGKDKSIVPVPPLPHSQSYPKSKHAPRPLLTEKDVRLLRRNAEELLQFHDRFVTELREAVGVYRVAKALVCSPHVDESSTQGHDGLDGVLLDGIDEAVAVVAERFVEQAPSFSIYEAFCPGHSEAANLVRHVQDTHPAEWDAYEQRCSTLLKLTLDTHLGDDEVDEVEMPMSVLPSGPSAGTLSSKKRRHSTSSLAMLSSPSRMDLPAAPAPPPEPVERDHKRDNSLSSSGHGHSGGGRSQSSSQAGKLKFLDYLIKPVQRVCKYPLLLEQLKNRRARTQSAIDPSTRPSKADLVGSGVHATRGDMGLDAVERASEAMRVVVGLVNRASAIRTQEVRSSLIAARLVFTHPPVSSSHASSASAAGTPSHPLSPGGKAQVLTLEFVASLGMCRLAGALDVVHHPSVLHTPNGGSLRAKYLGAFLYMGGYLVLVKITKGGKVFEPRYWFPLLGFDVLDFEDDEASLPYSFHLCGNGHHLQFAASCHKEKVIWMGAMQDSLTVSPGWAHDPPSSLQRDDRLPIASVGEDTPAEWSTTPLPTIQSLPELDSHGQEDVQSTESHGHAKPKAVESKPRASSKLECASLRQDPQVQAATLAALSRRSSTASVKAFFSPMSLESTTRVMRSSPQARQQTDQGLHDVFSEHCVAARSQALMREEELFQPRKRPGAPMPRSGSGLSITGAMGLAARRRYDSVLVARRKGSLDGHHEPHLTDSEAAAKHLNTLTGRSKSLAAKRRSKNLPSVLPAAPNLAKVESEAETDAHPPQGHVAHLDTDSPFPLSQCSSTTSSNAGSALPSPVDMPVPLMGDLAPDATIRQSDVLVAGEDWQPKRTRSMVNNVKSFFSRPASPSSSSSHHSPSPPSVAPPHEPEPESQPPPVQWWRRGSLRRRVQSSSSMPDESSPAPFVSRPPHDDSAALEVQEANSHLTANPSPVPSPAGSPEKSPSHPRRVAFTDTARRRSLFSSSSRQANPSAGTQDAAAPDVPPVQRKSLRNVWFFQRSNSFTPMHLKPPNA